MLALVLLPSWGMFLSGGPDQRWAYDLLVEPAAHGSTDLEDYGCYGTAVVAPVSARVHMASDGAPDHSPGQTSNDLENPTGNNSRPPRQRGAGGARARPRTAPG